MYMKKGVGGAAASVGPSDLYVHHQKLSLANAACQLWDQVMNCGLKRGVLANAKCRAAD